MPLKQITIETVTVDLSPPLVETIERVLLVSSHCIINTHCTREHSGFYIQNCKSYREFPAARGKSAKWICGDFLGGNDLFFSSKFFLWLRYNQLDGKSIEKKDVYQYKIICKGNTTHIN